MNELFDERVRLQVDTHTYHHKDGRVFESLSRVRNVIKPKFESDYLSKLTAQKRGISQAEVLGEWSATAKKATDHGTMVHLAMENYQNSALILPEHEHLRPMIVAVNALYKDYYAVHQEKTLYDEEYEIAGTADTICVTSRHKNSILSLTDFKTGGKGLMYESKYKKYLLPPFDYAQDCNYFDYSLQIISYGYMLEKLTGRKIGTLKIIYIPEVNPLAYKVIPVAYSRHMAEVLFNRYRELKHIHVEEGVTEEKKEIFLPNFN